MVNILKSGDKRNKKTINQDGFELKNVPMNNMSFSSLPHPSLHILAFTYLYYYGVECRRRCPIGRHDWGWSYYATCSIGLLNYYSPFSPFQPILHGLLLLFCAGRSQEIKY